MVANAKKLKRDLRKLGLSESAVEAAWPIWWSEDAANSASAQTELRFSLARKLGLDPRSLLEDGSPRFIWQGEQAKFKGLSTQAEGELTAIGAYGISLGKGLIKATEVGPSIVGVSALQLRSNILRNHPYIRLIDLLGLCWAIGLPVIHLRVFPVSAKRMCAMAVRIGERFAVLLGKDAQYPAPIAYYLAHELGHVALGHIGNGNAVIDLDDPLGSLVSDEDEIAADNFAIELLTGSSKYTVESDVRQHNATALATAALLSADALHVEPGTLALCFGHTTGEWQKANAAMKMIYNERRPVWNEVNGIAQSQLQWPDMSEDFAYFIQAVMGGRQIGAGSNR